MARFYGVPKSKGLGGRVIGPASRAAVTSKVRIFGVREALIKLGLVNKVARIHLGGLAHQTASAIERRAKENVPVITGNLKAGISKQQVGPYTWWVTASSLEGDVPEKNWYEYAHYVEFGTVQMEPRFFMTRAYRDTAPEVYVALQWIARELERL